MGQSEGGVGTPQGVGRVRRGRAEVKRENGTQGVGQAQGRSQDFLQDFF